MAAISISSSQSLRAHQDGNWKFHWPELPKGWFRKEKLHGMQACSGPMQIVHGWSPSCWFCAALGAHTSYFKINPWIYQVHNNPALDLEDLQILSLNYVFEGIYIGNNSTMVDISKVHGCSNIWVFLSCSVTGYYWNCILSISFLVYIYYCFLISLRRCIYHFVCAPLLFTKALKKSKEENDLGQILNNSSLGCKTVTHRN